MITAFVPVKPFGVAKQRLAGRLDPEQRARLGMAVAQHTLATCSQAGLAPIVVTPDRAVEAWAARLGFEAIREPGDRGLSAAAAFATKDVTGQWLLLHADLPLLDSHDLEELTTTRRTTLAPSHDGGTTAIASHGPFAFSYGPGSFRRHLAASAPDVRVVSRLGLAVDLDDAADLDVISNHPRGRWVHAFLG